MTTLTAAVRGCRVLCCLHGLGSRRRQRGAMWRVVERRDPKSVSAVWALGSEEQRVGVELAHGRAVARTLDHLRDEVPVVGEGAGGQVLSTVGDVIAAEFRHTTARGVGEGEAPDPQLHSHVVVTSVVRKDGQVGGSEPSLVSLGTRVGRVL